LLLGKIFFSFPVIFFDKFILAFMFR